MSETATGTEATSTVLGGILATSIHSTYSVFVLVLILGYFLFVRNKDLLYVLIASIIVLLRQYKAL